MKPQLIAQGAEAKIFLSDKIISKERTSKSYRHPILDEQIRNKRTKCEAKILTKALALQINVPEVISVDKHNLQIQFIEGDRLSETLNSYPKEKQYQTMEKLGHQTALLHQNNIIHGDLTTSNTILKDNEVFLIDFGLGFISAKIEDKAVDIHLIKQALEAKHFQNHEDLFKNFLKSYKWKEKNEVLERLKEVERRGRYKH
ncbi:MAG: KEOPS complex kinase/ATPase Bud32 [archaeon]|nr:KEOPS complex kinase/ATPase Bud32 [archaeon]MCR4323895.1 KEOPS complex kinase/ATPase Bud32 [Nanoarchaeota archaeon]